MKTRRSFKGSRRKSARALRGEYAVQVVFESTCSRLQIDDEYLRERTTDVKAHARGLLKTLGVEGGSIDMPDDAVLVAQDLSPRI